MEYTQDLVFTEGDTIMFRQQNGTPLIINNEEYILMDCHFIFGKMLENGFLPQGDRVLVEELAAEDKTAGGIIIPDSAKEKPNIGTIVAVAPGKKKTEPLFVKVGDKVLFDKRSGGNITVDGKDFRLLRQDDLLGCYE
jgi:chaperonin GroES